MKKILFILLLFFSLQSFAQFPVNSYSGTPTSTHLVRGLAASDSAFWYRMNFSDTSSANQGRIDEIAGAKIRTGDIMWLRNSTATAWIREGTAAANSCGLINGAYVTWDSLLIFTIAPAEYQLCCDLRVRNSSLTHKTLSAAHATLNRFDLIALDSTGVVVVTGTPATTPAQPQPSDCQIPLTYIYIPAGSTVPGAGSGGGTPSQSVIYDQNSEPWTGAASGVTINFSNTTNPYHLTIAADAGVFTAGQSFSFTKGSTITLSDYTSLKFYIRLKSTFNPQAKFGIFWQNTTSFQGSASVIMQSGNYNFVRTTVGSYQEITIPISAFLGGATTVVNKLYFLFLNTGNADGFYIDWIQLQGGISQPTTSGGGSVTSVSASSLSPLFTTTVTNPTTTPLISFAQISQSPYTVFGRASGSGIPSFVSLDTTFISGFSTKVRPLLSAGTGISYDNVTGIITNSSPGTTYTASNGITLSGNDFKWGGALTGATTISLAGFNLAFDGAASTGRIILDADNNVARIFSFRTDNLPRWAFRVDGNETGSNVGGDFQLRRYNDAGTFIDTVLFAKRSTGSVGVGTTNPTATRLDIVDNLVGANQIVNISSTSTAAASSLQKGLNINLSGANATASQSTYGAYLSNIHTGTSPANYGVYSEIDNTSSGSGVWGRALNAGTGVKGQSSSGPGVEGISSSGNGVYSQSTSGISLQVLSTSNLAATFLTGPASTNTVAEILRGLRNTSGLAADGIGGSFDFYIETDAGGTAKIANQIISKLTTAADATRTSQFIITGVNGAVTTDLAYFNGNGTMRWPQYGAGALTTDGSGNITAASDPRYKDITGYSDAGLKEVLKLHPIVYRWNKLSGYNMTDINVGFDANELKRYIPHSTGQMANGYLTMQDRPILAALVNSIKELNQRINYLEYQLKKRK
jgi:hypothetical protein